MVWHRILGHNFESIKRLPYMVAAGDTQAADVGFIDGMPYLTVTDVYPRWSKSWDKEQCQPIENAPVSQE